MPVCLEDLKDEGLGYVEFKKDKGKIVLDINDPPVGQHWALLHEIIHLALMKLEEKGIQVNNTEEFVTYLTGALFPMLAVSGLWNGVSRQEVLEFIEELERAEEEEEANNA